MGNAPEGGAETPEGPARRVPSVSRLPEGQRSGRSWDVASQSCSAVRCPCPSVRALSRCGSPSIPGSGLSGAGTAHPPLPFSPAASQGSSEPPSSPFVSFWPKSSHFFKKSSGNVVSGAHIILGISSGCRLTRGAQESAPGLHPRPDSPPRRCPSYPVADKILAVYIL